MSEQGSEVLSEQPSNGSGPGGSSSENGVGPGIGAGAADGSPAEAAIADDGSAFLAELVRTMQATASLERARISENVERRRQASIDEVRARESSEADRMRELAADDMKAIQAWADGETRRIKLERERRASELHADLDLSLAEHRSKIDQEIERIEAAITTYRADVDLFFDGLDRETDPVAIAQLAAKRPVFPTVSAMEPAPADSSAEPPPPASDAGAADQESTDAAEPAVVGVMDPQAAAQHDESWKAPPETSPEPVPVGASDEDQRAETAESVEPVAQTGGLGHGNGGFLLASMPVIRPMGWLRRDANEGERANREG